MSAELVAYPFLFIAIFFQSFVLLTFLSAPARRARSPVLSGELPKVAIVVPCHNEETTIGATVRSLLALEYPHDKLSLVLVDNGSTDGTAHEMARFAHNPQVTLLHEATLGKHVAMNAGIAATDAEIIGCLDADSFVEPDALSHLIPGFTKREVAATTAAMSVHEPANLLEYMQYAEYLFGIAWRHALAAVNGLYVTPGPFSLYRRDIVVAQGGFRHGHQVEDMEMALRLQRAGYEIENAPRARVYTKAPSTLRALLKQRTRWTSGFLRNALFDYRDLLGNPSYGALGLMVLPLALLSIAGSLYLLASALVSTSTQVAHAVTVRSGVPMSYAYLPGAPSFDWFFLPATVFGILAFATIVSGVSLIIIGKHISRTPGRLVPAITSYLLLYGIVSPVWLAHAVIDVALGKRRVWR